MYTRNVRLKLRADSGQEFRRVLEQKNIPLLRAQKFVVEADEGDSYWFLG